MQKQSAVSDPWRRPRPTPGDGLAIWPPSPNPTKHIILSGVATPRGRREPGRTPLILVATVTTLALAGCAQIQETGAYLGERAGAAGSYVSDRFGAATTAVGRWASGRPDDDATSCYLLSELSARNVLLLLDTCYAGAFHLQGPGNLANESGRFVLTGSSSVDEALDSYDGTNGVFAYAVREGLYGAAADASGDDIDALQLGVYVRRALPRLARERRHQQSAVFKAAGGDLAAFPVAAVPRPAAGPVSSPGQ